MKTEYTEYGGFLQRDSVEHKEYAEALSAERQEAEERDGADLLERVLDRDNLNRAYKRVKANKGASGIDGMTVDEALPWLKEHKDSGDEERYGEMERVATQKNTNVYLEAVEVAENKGRKLKEIRNARLAGLQKRKHSKRLLGCCG